MVSQQFSARLGVLHKWVSYLCIKNLSHLNMFQIGHSNSLWTISTRKDITSGAIYPCIPGRCSNPHQTSIFTVPCPLCIPKNYTGIPSGRCKSFQYRWHEDNTAFLVFHSSLTLTLYKSVYSLNIRAGARNLFDYTSAAFRISEPLAVCASNLFQIVSLGNRSIITCSTTSGSTHQILLSAWTTNVCIT